MAGPMVDWMVESSVDCLVGSSAAKLGKMLVGWTAVYWAEPTAEQMAVHSVAPRVGQMAGRKVASKELMMVER